MADGMKCVVVIPVYSASMNLCELMSFRHNVGVLGANNDICIVCPDGMNTAEYHKNSAYQLAEQRFDNAFFKSIGAYCQLLTSEFFYKRFAQYDYMLICHVDAYVFSDRLGEFMRLGYDYYGAPWPHLGGRIGNGGLSLRKIKPCIDVTERHGPAKKQNDQVNSDNEDVYFSITHSDAINVCPFEVGRRFSIEYGIDKYFDGSVPFGIHKWFNIDFSGWIPYVMSAERELAREKVDVFIPSTVKDYRKLNYTISSIIKYVPEANDFYVSMPDKQNIKDCEIDGHKIYFFNDFEVLPGTVDLSKCSFRPNWILQQLLKLCQRKTKTRYVFICDSDIVFTNEFSLFDSSGKPILPAFEKHNDETGFIRFISRFSHGDLCGSESDYDGIAKTRTQYISDLMVFENGVIDEMLLRYGFTMQEFIDFTLSSTYFRGDCSTAVFISEYELYGKYVEKYRAGQYRTVMISHMQFDKFQPSQNIVSFSDDEIRRAIRACDVRKYNILKLQTGCVASDIVYKKGGESRGNG